VPPSFRQFLKYYIHTQADTQHNITGGFNKMYQSDIFIHPDRNMPLLRDAFQSSNNIRKRHPLVTSIPDSAGGAKSGVLNCRSNIIYQVWIGRRQ
jgi:hypothetical protein